MLFFEVVTTKTKFLFFLIHTCICTLVHTVGASNLRYLTRTTNTITIVWGPADSPNCGPVLYYTVIIVNSVDANDMNTTVTSERGIEFSNLTNGTSYNISVAAVNRAGTGLTSTISVTTLVVDVEGKLFIAHVHSYVHSQAKLKFICNTLAPQIKGNHRATNLMFPSALGQYHDIAQEGGIPFL